MNAPEYIGVPIGPRGKNAVTELTGLNKAWGLLPHEVFFGLFLLVTWVRLVSAASSSTALGAPGELW